MFPYSLDEQDEYVWEKVGQAGNLQALQKIIILKNNQLYQIWNPFRLAVWT
jgi:hypothetical protein